MGVPQDPANGIFSQAGASLGDSLGRVNHAGCTSRSGEHDRGNDCRRRVLSDRGCDPAAPYGRGRSTGGSGRGVFFHRQVRKVLAWSLEHVGRDPARRGGAVELVAPPIGPAAIRSDRAVGPGARRAPAGFPHSASLTMLRPIALEVCRSFSGNEDFLIDIEGKAGQPIAQSGHITWARSGQLEGQRGLPRCREQHGGPPRRPR